MKKIMFLVLSISFVCLLGMQNGFAQSKNLSEAEIKALIIQTLKENPEVILDILSANNEIVLEIAQEGAHNRRLKSFLAQWKKDLLVKKEVLLVNRPSLGKNNAPVTIVAFTDFTCSYCQQSEETLRKIYALYPNQVRIVYKMLPMSSHPGAKEAAQFFLAANLQDSKKSIALAEEFFANRSKILSVSSDSYLRAAVTTLKLDMRKLLADAGGASIKNLLAEDVADAKSLNVIGTPFFLVNDLVVNGALQDAFFIEAVELALKHSPKASK